MAVARKIKTLLTVNILVFVGVVLFSVYCRLQDRSEALVQVVRGADRPARGRHAKAGALADREAILQRLDHLEEVVYNQLNGERLTPPHPPTHPGPGGRWGGQGQALWLVQGPGLTPTPAPPATPLGSESPRLGWESVARNSRGLFEASGGRGH
jgi:hypothetical protein